MFSTEPENEYLLNEWKLIAESIRLMSSLDIHSIIIFQNGSISRSYDLREIGIVLCLSLLYNSEENLIIIMTVVLT